jgi:hypothetical protein
MYLSDKYTLNFVVRTGLKSKSGDRKFFEFEIGYPSQYPNINTAYSIKRSMMNFYFTIENKDSFDSSIMMKINDVYTLRTIINNIIMKWYFGDSRIYDIIDDRLIINGKFNKVIFTLNEYKFLTFVPIIIEYEDGSFKEGIRIYINSPSEYVELSIDRFIYFYSLLNPDTMYLQACCLVNYMKMEPYDQNLFAANVGLGANPNQNNFDNYSKNNNFLNNAKKK